MRERKKEDEKLKEESREERRLKEGRKRLEQKATTSWSNRGGSVGDGELGRA